MGQLLSILKSGTDGMTSKIKSFDVAGQVRSAVSSSVSNLKLPNVEFDPNKNLGDLTRPLGATGYLTKIDKSVLSNIKMPTSINGVSLPQFPDLSAAIPDISSLVSGLGIDTNVLGIRDISSILKEPNLASLGSVKFDSPVDMDNLPDVNHLFDGFNINGVQSQIDELKNTVPGMGNFDISKYF